ncbi:high mobility group box domain-containing protein [Syncephalastrum racemosum]|uniref:High mobility group box domain-containing protein n=1 Tax=Syncephalastrum racemosum TaxID=13706 RepID=A0A1X2HHI7_SYNRA|nr:high mobility group box domain-containing protein [Syncephalastrum racemosum]
MAKAKLQQRIPRPMNCFIAFRIEKQKEIQAQIPGINHRSISKIVAKWWKQLSEAEKEPYKKRAELAKQEHEQVYPAYRFCPQKRVGNKRKYVKKKQDDAGLLTKVEMLSMPPSSVFPSPALSHSTTMTTPSTEVIVKKEEDEEDVKLFPEYYTMSIHEYQPSQQHDLIHVQPVYSFQEGQCLTATALSQEQYGAVDPFVSSFFANAPPLLDYVSPSMLTLSHPPYVDPALHFYSL